MRSKCIGIVVLTLMCYSVFGQKRDTVNQSGYGGTLIYRIQIGSIGNKPQGAAVLKRYHITQQPTYEADGANTIKLLVGNYPDYSHAETAMNELKRKGVKGAFVVPYYKGQRVSLQEAASHTGE